MEDKQIQTLKVRAKVAGAFRAQELKSGEEFTIPKEYAGRTDENLGLAYFNSDWMELTDEKDLEELQTQSDKHWSNPSSPDQAQAFVPKDINLRRKQAEKEQTRRDISQANRGGTLGASAGTVGGPLPDAHAGEGHSASVNREATERTATHVDREAARGKSSDKSEKHYRNVAHT